MSPFQSDPRLRQFGTLSDLDRAYTNGMGLYLLVNRPIVPNTPIHMSLPRATGFEIS